MRCCAFSKLPAIGPPMLPRPINPIIAIRASYSAGLSSPAKRSNLVPPHQTRRDCFVAARLAMTSSGKTQLAPAERREIGVDLGVVDLDERRRPPARVLILIDNDRANALVKIVSGHEMRCQPVFQRERLF